MARATSTISVAITGDSKKLQGALKGAEKGVGRFGSSMKGAAIGIGSALAGVFAISKGFEFLQDSIKESDRAGDALSNLNRIIGKVNAKKIEKVASSLTDIGLSTSDVLELSVGFARIARTIGLSPNLIANYADDVAAVGKAMSLVDEKGRDAATFIELIAKAASKPAKGTSKQLQALGLGASASAIERTAIKRALEDSGKKNAGDLTEAEKNAARLLVIMRKLKGIVPEALANPDVELQQAKLQARIKNLEKEIGDNLQPIVADLLQSLLDIGKSQWVSDLMLGFETVKVGFKVFQDDVLPPLISDLNLGAKTVEIALGDAGDEAEIMGVKVVDQLADIAEALIPVPRNIGDIIIAFGEIPYNVGKALESVLGFVTDAKSALNPLVDLLRSIDEFLNGRHTATFRIGIDAPRIGHNAPSSKDRQTNAAVERERERNGLGK